LIPGDFGPKTPFDGGLGQIASNVVVGQVGHQDIENAAVLPSRSPRCARVKVWLRAKFLKPRLGARVAAAGGDFEHSAEWSFRMHGDAGFGRDCVNLVAEPLEFFSFAVQGVGIAPQLRHALEESGTHLVFGYERELLPQDPINLGRGEAFLGLRQEHHHLD
jgi:hypothetical protein